MFSLIPDSIRIICCFLLIVILFSISCNRLTENLPENYGIYASTEKGLMALAGQRIQARGNLLEAISGLKGASGSECTTLNNFIIFEKDINPKHIHLSKLIFREKASVQNLFGSDLVEISLWVDEKDIPFDIAPIEDKKDMYRITPKERLTEGFYAIHFGGLAKMSMLEASMGNMAYDLVVGNKKKYLSKEQRQSKLKTEAERLLQEMNGYFNSKNYDKMKAIYRPDGNTFTDGEWQEFTKGLATWHNEAGSIKESKIISSEVNGDYGVFAVETFYEKKGSQNERLTIKKNGDAYFIMALE